MTIYIYKLFFLRYINPPELCNGTKKLLPNAVEATILKIGKSNAEDVLIPRIRIVSTDMPFDFKRLQFPSRFLLNVLFTWSVYVACWRAEKCISFFAKDGKPPPKKYSIS